MLGMFITVMDEVDIGQWSSDQVGERQTYVSTLTPFFFVGQVKDIPRAVERWKGQIEDLKMFSFYRDAVGIDGEAIEFELTNFPWLSSLSILREIQQEPEGRFWVQVRKRNCVAIHTVKKDWNCTANEMVQRFKETGHLVSESINALSRVILKQRKGRRTIHFNGDSMNTELLFQTVHSVIQLSVLRSRYEMLLSIQFERRRKRTSWYSCGLGFCPWWSRKKCHCWYWHKQNTPANSIWLSTGPLFCVSRFVGPWDWWWPLAPPGGLVHLCHSPSQEDARRDRAKYASEFRWQRLSAEGALAKFYFVLKSLVTW